MVHTLNPTLLAFAVVLLIIGSTLRVSRFLTTDDLGEWLIRRPLRRWAVRREEARVLALAQVMATTAADREAGKLSPGAEQLLVEWEADVAEGRPLSAVGRFVSSFDCPFCIGFWAGAVIIALTAVLIAVPVVGIIWLGIMSALSLNYLVGHMSSRLD